MTLKGLVFSDLFVTGEVATSWYKATPDSPAPAQLLYQLTVEGRAAVRRLG